MLNEVSFCLHKQRRTQYGDHVGTVRLGDFEESFHVSTRYWSPNDYTQQWEDAAAAIRAGGSMGCFVASLADPLVPESLAFLWSYYRTEDELVFRNSMRFLSAIDFPLPTGAFESWVSPRESEDGEVVSEWSLPLAELRVAVEVFD